MSGNGHQVTFGRHDVTKQGQMPVVDVKAVEIQHSEDFFFHTFSHSFNTQNGEDLANVVGRGSGWIDVSFG